MLKKIYKVKLNLELLSGMHITGSSDTFDIGGADSQVIKNPLTKEPYIPGSSLKGKLRSLLEYRYSTIQGSDLAVVDCDKLLLALFEASEEIVPNITRGIFRDLTLTEESKKTLQLYLGDSTFTEIKAENSINRIKGTANSPRFIERVPAHSKFYGEIDVLEFESDETVQLLKYLKEALELLNHNFIGGSGTRGYGRVDITYEIEEIEL